MNRMMISFVGMLFLFLGSTAQAEEGKLSGTFDVTYMSKLMDKGGEYYGQQGGAVDFRVQKLEVQLAGNLATIKADVGHIKTSLDTHIENHGGT